MFAAPKRNLDGGLEASSKPLISPPLGQQNTSITGTTMNSSFVAIPNCTVDLFFSSTNAWYRRTTSDGSGNFTFVGPGLGPFYMRAVDSSGNPVGTTISTLSPT